MNDMCESKPEEHSDRDYCPHCSTCHVCLEEADTDNEAKVKSLKAEIAHLKGSTPSKGEPMPKTIQHYQANAERDQELILEQKEEISKLKQKVNKLGQLKQPEAK